MKATPLTLALKIIIFFCISGAPLLSISRDSVTSMDVENKKQLYQIYLNPFTVAERTNKAFASGYKRPEIPELVKDDEREAYLARNIQEFRYSPGAEDLKKYTDQTL